MSISLTKSFLSLELALARRWKRNKMAQQKEKKWQGTAGIHKNVVDEAYTGKNLGDLS